MEDDDDSSSSSRSRAARKNQKDGRKLTPTVDEDLLTELESNFSKQSVLVTKMMAAKDVLPQTTCFRPRNLKTFWPNVAFNSNPFKFVKSSKVLGVAAAKRNWILTSGSSTANSCTPANVPPTDAVPCGAVKSINKPMN
jgi:hypothetical protein